MDLTHEFTVPASRAETWAAFNDIESVAGCFPGATVTSVEGDTFSGSCKVKLGPIALVYNGSGSFVEKDEAAGVMKIEAKGKDKRGNGTAGADVTATLTEAGADQTRVVVVTDLNITGKPAQFGRGVMQDVSDKLLDQFVECLKTKVGAPESVAAPESGAASSATQTSAEGTGDARSGADAAGGADAVGGKHAAGPTAGTGGGASAPAGSASPSRSASPAGQSAPPADNALDLGATVLPVLLKSYGKQLAAGLGVLAVLVWLLRRGCR